MAHMHLRLASAKRCKESKTNCDNNLYEESAETNGIHNNHLGAAQRHYLRFVKKSKSNCVFFTTFIHETTIMEQNNRVKVRKSHTVDGKINSPHYGE